MSLTNLPRPAGMLVASLLTALFLVGACEAPFSPLAENTTSAVQASTALAFSPGAVATHYVEVNTRHGNSSGLPVNLNGIRNSRGSSDASLTVSVLGRAEFDLAAVDLSSLRIGDVNTVPATPLRTLNKKSQASIVDLDGDGIKDLMLHFSLSEMVANGNIFDTTTQLCLTGQGPGYVLGGCDPAGPGGGDGGGGGGGGPGVSTVLIAFGLESSPQKTIWAGSLLPDEPFDQDFFPGWQTVEMETLTVGNWPAPGDRAFRSYTAPLGPLWFAARLSEACGLMAADYRWPMWSQMLIRTDLVLPPGASQLSIDFVADDEARVYLNGTELTRGFQSGRGDCAYYSEAVRLRVNDSLLAPDGRNKLAVWTRDNLGYVNFFDFQVTAQIPN